MSNILVSVIIPAYNASKTVEQSIQSVLDQTYLNLEVIVIDDGSTDDTLLTSSNIIDERLFCFRIKNSGASAARNYGLKKAKGDYIQFLDADDILNLQKIEQQMLLLEHTNFDIAYCDWTYMNDNSIETETVFNSKPYAAIASGKDLLRSMGKDKWFVPVFCWLTKRSIIDKAGLWNESLSNNDDGEFFTRVLYNSKKIARVPKILGHYRRNYLDSLSKSNTTEKVISAFCSFNLIISYFQEKADESLMVYPKRLFEVQFLLTRHTFPVLARQAGKGFDRIKEKSNISPKLLNHCVALFGLYRGYQCFDLLHTLLTPLRKLNNIDYEKVKEIS